MREKHVFGPFEHGASPALQRADLEIYGINHFRPSYVALVFFNAPDLSIDEATEDHESYAGSFAVFGHGRCVGDEGHCEVHPHARRFDDRPSHPLTRAFKRVVVTEALRKYLGSKDLTITLVVSSDPEERTESGEPLLDFEGMSITTFN
jgi:hypothetical protein